MAEEMVRVTLGSSYGYVGPDGARKYYGPGKDIPVPEGLARALGLSTEGPETPPPEIDPANPPDNLPEELPGRDKLLEAGYGTIEAVAPLTYKDLIAISGIGPATARAIIKELGENDVL